MEFAGAAPPSERFILDRRNDIPSPRIVHNLIFVVTNQFVTHNALLLTECHNHLLQFHRTNCQFHYFLTRAPVFSRSSHLHVFYGTHTYPCGVIIIDDPFYLHSSIQKVSPNCVDRPLERLPLTLWQSTSKISLEYFLVFFCYFSSKLFPFPSNLTTAAICTYTTYTSPLTV